MFLWNVRADVLMVSMYARMICKSDSSILHALMAIQLAWFAIHLYILLYCGFILPKVILAQRVSWHHNPHASTDEELAASSRLSDRLTAVSERKVMRTDGNKILIPLGTPQTGPNRRQRTHNDGARLCNNCCSGKSVKYYILTCVCSLWYPACNAHVPYCHLWLYHIFSTLSHKWHDFLKKKKVPENICFQFLYNFCLKHFSF